jgi:hypothetical protein
MVNLPATHSKRISAFLDKVQTARGRLIFAVDATGSRQPTWDAATRLTAEMFNEAGRIGMLELQLVYYRDLSECKATQWTIDPRVISNAMVRITCLSGPTQIAKTLAHVRKEHMQQPVNAAVFIGDAMEETPHELYDAAAGLGVPLFMFQEGNDPAVEQTFQELVRLTRGAYAKFDTGSAGELGELLRVVAVFATGGLAALADQRSDVARKLLTQIKGGEK